jgi:hypothetical protein
MDCDAIGFHGDSSIHAKMEYDFCLGCAHYDVYQMSHFAYVIHARFILNDNFDDASHSNVVICCFPNCVVFLCELEYDSIAYVDCDDCYFNVSDCVTPVHNDGLY